MFFDGWESIGRMVLVAACVYVLLIIVLRVVGQRALAKMSAYDLIVTVALGSLVAAIPLSADVTVADGVAVIATYLILQEATRWLSHRFRPVRHAVREQPLLVVWEGRMLRDQLDDQQLTEEEVRAAVRYAGKSSISEVLAVVLENDGGWSVIPRGDPTDWSALEGLKVPENVPKVRDRPVPRRPEFADRAPGKASEDAPRPQGAL
jgi:uncharacterized membrane protein YcaP (DUF421 family)